MSVKPFRARPHRRKNCGTSQKITIAYYILTQRISDSEKLRLCSNYPNLIGIEQAFEDNRYLFMFDDESILGYDEERSFYVTDTWGRFDAGKKPTSNKSHYRKAIYV